MRALSSLGILVLGCASAAAPDKPLADLGSAGSAGAQPATITIGTGGAPMSPEARPASDAPIPPVVGTGGSPLNPEPAPGGFAGTVGAPAETAGMAGASMTEAGAGGQMMGGVAGHAGAEPTGGAATGGAATGGVPTGGTSTGGVATGGRPPDVVETMIFDAPCILNWGQPTASYSIDAPGGIGSCTVESAVFIGELAGSERCDGDIPDRAVCISGTLNADCCGTGFVRFTVTLINAGWE